MQYILAAVKNKNDEGCIFCTKPQADDDAKNLIVLRDKTASP